MIYGVFAHTITMALKSYFWPQDTPQTKPVRGRDMARSLMAKCLALTAAAVALFALPSAFVPARQGAPAVSPAVAAGVAAGSMALPAWAYDMPDAQILLARVPGGKRTKELGLVVPIPEEDGLTDGQIAALFVVALVGLIAAVDLAKTLYFGINPTKFKTAKGKGSITPFMKRLIENGYWATVCLGRCPIGRARIVGCKGLTSQEQRHMQKRSLCCSLGLGLRW